MTNFRPKLLFLTNHKKIGNLSTNFIVISNHSIRFMTNNLHCTTDSVTVSHKSSLHLLYHRYLLRLAGWWRLLNNFWRCLGTVTNGAVRVCVWVVGLGHAGRSTQRAWCVTGPRGPAKAEQAA